MARQLILKNLMKLAQGIGANPNKFMGTRTNITFLGKGPTKNPLFQQPLAGIDEAAMKQLGPGIVPAVEDAMGFATANKLNDIQLKILTDNLMSINKVLNPPVLPTASVTAIRPGIEGLRRFPKESHQFFRQTAEEQRLCRNRHHGSRGQDPGTRDRRYNGSVRSENRNVASDCQKSFIKRYTTES